MSSARFVVFLVTFTALTGASWAQMQPAGQPGAAAGGMPDIKTKIAQFTQKITAGLNQFKAQIMGTLNGLMAKKGLPPMGGAPPAAGGQPAAPPPPAAGPLVFGQPRPNMLQPQRQNPRRMIGSSVARVNNPSRNRPVGTQPEDRRNPVDNTGEALTVVSTNSNGKTAAALTAKEDDVTAGSVKEQVSKMMDNIERELTDKV